MEKVILSNEDIQYLQSIGFKQDDKKFKGFYFIQNETQTIVLIPQHNNTYKLEFYEMCEDGEGGWYEDFDKRYSTKEQTLKQFIAFWLN